MESNKPRILIFTDWYLPGYKAGGPIKSCVNLVALLHPRFAFFVVCSDRDYLEQRPYPDMEPGAFRPVGEAQVRYLTPEEENYRQIADLIKTLSPDRVYVNGLFSRTYSIFPLLAAKRLKKRVVVAPRGMLAPGALAIKSLKKKVFLSGISLLGGYRNVEFHATDATEAEHIRSNLGRKTAISVVPNIPGTIRGQAPQRHTPKNPKTPVRKTENHLNLLTVARIAPEKNIAFALECLRELPPHITVRHLFIGSVYDEKYAEQCHRLADSLPDNVRVEFPGPLSPATVGERLDEADLFFLPTLGENYGHAIIESLLADVPVLITDRTPWRNLEAEGLGLDAVLGDKRTFVDYLTKIAEMDYAEYTEKFGGVAENAKRLVNIPQICESYLTLLS